MHRTVAALALFAALAAPASAAPAPAPDEVTTDVAARIDRALQAATGEKKGLSPALSVAVVEHGDIVYARAFGVADLATKTAATPATRFPIASVTKMFTAVSVMQLVEAGRVRLDAPLGTYLPSAPHAGEVTIRQLLTHTSGLWNYGDEAFNSGRAATPTTPSAILAAVAAHPLDFKPGTKFSYSNTGYVLLGLVVEAVAKVPLAAYEREHIFGPAQMHDTTVGAPPAGVPVARGYMDASGTPAPPYSPSWVFADGDIVSTASDLARFDVALMDGRLLKPATFAEMQSSAVDAAELGASVRYGLGVSLATSGGVTFVGHHGGVPGFEAENELIPSERYAIVVLSDAFDFPTPVANAAVLQQTLPSVLAQARAAQAAAAAAAEDPAVTAMLRAFVTGVQAGTVDRSTLDEPMNAALTPAALDQLKAQFAPLGSLRSLAFRAKQPVQVYVAYRYDATFSSGQTVPLTLVLDKDGKISGFH